MKYPGEIPCVKSTDLPAAIDELARKAWMSLSLAGKDKLFFIGGSGDAPGYSWTNTHASIRREEDGKLLDVKMPTLLRDILVRRAGALVGKMFNNSSNVYQPWQDGFLQEKRAYKGLAKKNIPALTVVDVDTPYVVTEHLDDLVVFADRLIEAEPREKVGLLGRAADQLRTLHNAYGAWGDAWMGNFAFHEGVLLALDFENAPNPLLTERAKRAKDIMNFYLNSVGCCAQGTLPLEDEHEIAVATLEAYNPSKHLAFSVGVEAVTDSHWLRSHPLQAPLKVALHHYPVQRLSSPQKVLSAQDALYDVIRSEFL